MEGRMKVSPLWQHLARYVFAAQFVEGKAVLDIACGNGYGSSCLISKHALNVVGGDNSEAAISFAQHHYQTDGLCFLSCDAQQMQFADNSFDVVVSMETIEHLERYEDFLKECRRVLKDDGLFICSTPNRKALFGIKNPWHFREFSLDEFYELIGRYFAHVELYGQGFLKKREAIKRESIRRLGPVIRFIPQPIKSLPRRFIYPEAYRFASLAEVYPNFTLGLEEQIDKQYMPFLLCQGSPLCRVMIAVAKN